MANKSSRSFLMLVGLLVLGFGVIAAQAQPKKPGAGDPSKTETEGEAAETETDDEASAEDEVVAGDDLGEPPPPRKQEPDPEKRSSPLNPEPDEFPEASARPPGKEYDELLSKIAALRSRVAALTTTLFKSKLRVLVETEGDDARIDSLIVTLDDGVVFTAPERFIAEDSRVVFEHSVAPGHHVIGVEVERHDARGSQFKTWQSSKFSVIVPESQFLEAEIELEDDSDMADDFPDGQDGQYELRVKLHARVTEE